MLIWAGFAPLVGAAVPAAPAECTAMAISATATHATLEIQWQDQSTDETQWNIQYSRDNWATTSGLSVTSAATAGMGTINYTLPEMDLNSVYRFKVIAVNSVGSSIASNVATVGTYDCAAPGNLRVVAVDPFHVIMSWEEFSTAEAGFAIERRIGAGPWVYLGAVGANNLAIDPSPLIQPLGTFNFRVRAYKGSPPTTPDSPADANVSAYSAEIPLTSDAYTLVASAVPCQPVIKLTWPDTAAESGYQIVSKEAGAASYAFLTLVAADITNYQVNLPDSAAGHAYSFKVQPYVGNQIIGESSEAGATVDDVIANMTSQAGISGTPGSPLSHTFVHESDATVSARALTGVPSGLAFNSETGVLSGIYPPVGNYTLEYAVNFTTGNTLHQTFYIRVRPPAAAPGLGTIIPAWNGSVGETRDTVLDGTFIDPEAESAVRIRTTLGDMDCILFNTATPATVTNFMSYVNADKFSDTAFHRSIAGFVIQGGGYKGAGTGNQFTSMVTEAPVINEPGIANERGTLSMAKLGGDPDSATSQFFVSLGDNRSNLDFQNGGFTVFGRVAGDGMAVADAISNLPTATYQLIVDGNDQPTSFTDFPMNAASCPDPIDQSQLVKVLGVTPIPTLSYHIVNNTRPDVVSPSIINGNLHLVGLAAGQATITVAATDLDHQTTTQTVEVNVVNNKPMATVTLSGLAAKFNGAAKAAKVTTKPGGLPVIVTYNGSSVAPTQAGSYAVVATINHANYQGTASGTMVISKAPASVKPSKLTVTYTGGAVAATATTKPAGLHVDYTYNGSADMPVNAGTYTIVATIDDPNYQGKATGKLVIAKATATATLGNLAMTYDGSAKSATATTSPEGLPVNFTYKGSATAPTNVGSYAVVGTINDPNYQGKITGTLGISKASATVTLGNLDATYTGAAKPATAITSPAGLPVKITYNGSSSAPKKAGSYAVVATVAHANYQGSTTGTLVISPP